MKLLPLVLALFAVLPAFAQKFEANDYVKALWMTTRFYGAQRSGEGPNWLIMESEYPKSFTKDAVNGVDVSGGWFDCGDHVMFGQTQYYSAYMLAKAYEQFPKGFHDFYSPDYSGYVASQQWNEPTGGKPNYIPDVIDELVYEADYIAKAVIDANTFVTMKGEGGPDHTNWVTAGFMSTLPVNQGGEPRAIETAEDKSMPSFAAATLSVMARILDSLQIYPERSALYKTKAVQAYERASSATKNQGAPFYNANGNMADDYATASIEMYKLTGEEKYLANAKAQVKEGDGGVKNQNYYVLCYDSNDDLAWFNLATTPGTDVGLGSFIEKYKKSTNEGMLDVDADHWGYMRYPSNAAFMLALEDKANGNAANDEYIQKHVDFIMGKNNNNQSFISGFGAKSPQYPHHRNVYLNNENLPDDAKNALKIPERNRSFGALVGNNDKSSSYTESATNYASSEVCIDYNAGLVGALAYVVSKVAPADVKPPTPIRTNPAQSLNPGNPDSDIFDLRGNRIGRSLSEVEGPGIYIVRQGALSRTVVVR
jgi:hypothetical protein